MTTNINTHRRCETCDAYRPKEDPSSWVPYGDCVAEPPKLLTYGSRLMQAHPAAFATHDCRKWLPSADYQQSRGLMTPVVSGRLVKACKDFVRISDNQLGVWSFDVGELKNMIESNAEAIRDALKAQGVDK